LANQLSQYHQQFARLFGGDGDTAWTPAQQKIATDSGGNDAATLGRQLISLKHWQRCPGWKIGREIRAAAESAGADSKQVSRLFDSKSTTKMVMPKS